MPKSEILINCCPYKEEKRLVADLPIGDVFILAYYGQEHLCIKSSEHLFSLSNPSYHWEMDAEVRIVRQVRKLEIKEVP